MRYLSAEISFSIAISTFDGSFFLKKRIIYKKGYKICMN